MSDEITFTATNAEAVEVWLGAAFNSHIPSRGEIEFRTCAGAAFVIARHGDTLERCVEGVHIRATSTTFLTRRNDDSLAMLAGLSRTSLVLLAWQSMEVVKRLEAERDRLTSLSSLAELDAMRAVVKAAELWDHFGNVVEIKLALAAYRKATRETPDTATPLAPRKAAT